MGIVLVKNVQRILHIPFFNADSSLSQSQKLEVEMASLDKAGQFIKLGKKLSRNSVS